MRSRLTFILLLCSALLAGCTGGGAVNPLTPSNSQKTSADSASVYETVYWLSQPSVPPATATLLDACLVSSKLGWACGTGGAILQYDGKGWKPVTTGLAGLGDLYALSFPDENEGWIVGIRGTMVSFRDGKWSLAASPVEETLNDVVFTRSRRGWAVGTNGTLLTYNGTAWDPVSLTTKSDLLGLGFYSEGGGWAVGDRGTLVQYDGAQWKVFEGSPVSDKLQKISVMSDVEAWAVGGMGALLRFNGTAWLKVPGPFSQDLYDVWMEGPQNGWAVGQDGSMLHYDGSRWVSQKPAAGKPSLNALAFFKKNLGFAVGQNGTILKFQPGGVRTEGTLKVELSSLDKTEGENPDWKVVFTVLNEGGKPVSNAVLEASLPKDFHPVKLSPTPVSSPGAVIPTPTPSVQWTAVSQGEEQMGRSADGNAANRSGVAPAIGWKFEKGRVIWNLGMIDSGVSRTLTMILARKETPKGSKPVQAVLNLTTKSGGRVLSNYGPYHLDAEPPFTPTPSPALSTSNAPAPTPTPNL